MTDLSFISQRLENVGKELMVLSDDAEMNEVIRSGRLESKMRNLATVVFLYAREIKPEEVVSKVDTCTEYGEVNVLSDLFSSNTKII